MSRGEHLFVMSPTVPSIC